MTQTKYIPCESRHLRIGQVVEIHISNINGKKFWHRFMIDDESTLFVQFERLRNCPEKIRIPTLTHEDILDLGWVFMEESDSTVRYILKHNELEWFKPYADRYGELYIWRDIEDAELFHIQTPLEFKDLMRMLGITTPSN